MGIFKEIYRFFFGKSYRAVWQQFVNDKKGTFVIGENGNGDAVEIIYKNHKIILDTYTQISVVGATSREKDYTRGRLEFVLSDDFKFKLFKKGFIDTIGKLFGMQDIKIGDHAFDKAFIIKGNDESKVQSLFSNDTLKDLVLLQKDIRLEIMDKAGVFDEKIQEGNSLLYFISEDKIKNTDQLNTLYKLFTALIDQLSKICSVKPMNVTK